MSLREGKDTQYAGGVCLEPTDDDAAQHSLCGAASSNVVTD